MTTRATFDIILEPTMPTKTPPKRQRANGQGLDVVTGLQLLQHTSTDAAALVILKTAIDEIQTLRTQLATILQAIRDRAEQNAAQQAQAQQAAARLRAKRQQETAEQDQ